MDNIEINLNPLVPALPQSDDKTKIDVRYMVIAPYVSIHIYYDIKIGEVLYDIEEPILDEDEKKNLSRIEQAMREIVNLNILEGEKTIENLIDYFNKTSQLIISELGLTIEGDSFKKMFYYLYRDFIGLNEIEPMMRDYFIEDIECNGIGEPIYIVHRVFRNIKTNVKFKDMDKLSNFVEKLAQKTGRYISYASPILDGSLPDGSLDYEEPFIYKEDGLIKVSKIGKFVDKFYSKDNTNKPADVKGIFVPAYNKDTLKVEWKKLDYVYRHKNKGKLYRLSAELGKKINLTGAHSLFILKSDGIKPGKVSDLRVGDYVISPAVIPDNNVSKRINVARELSESENYKKFNIKSVPGNIFEENKKEIFSYLKKEYKQSYQSYYELRKKRMLPIKLYNILREDVLEKCEIITTSPVSIKSFLEISPELMRLLGYYIAEGWTAKIRNHRRIIFCFNKNEIDLIEDVRKCFMDGLGVKIYIEPVKKNAVKIVVNSILVWEIFNKVLNVSHYAKEKRVPEIVFNVGKNLRMEFLKAWHDGDCGSTVSKKLAEDISLLSLLNGDSVPFYDRKREGCIEGRKTFSHEFYTNFYRREKSNFSKLIPVEVFGELNKTHWQLRNKKVSRERLRSMLEENRYLRFGNLEKAPDKFIIEWKKIGHIKNGKLTKKGVDVIKEMAVVEKLLDSDLGFFKVRDIERVDSTKDFVYDVSVPGNESFVGGFGGLMCHNSRVNATYTQDISSKGPTFTIRKFTKTPWTPTQLIGLHELSPEMLAYFWILLQYQSNIMIVGGTASGKTTLLNALAFFIPQENRIVSIEDTRELNLPKENWLPSVVRTGVSGSGIGDIDMFSLLKGSFRQNPDYVIVGEVRGKEASVLFQGMASGHASISTMHADSVDSVIQRLETPPINLSPMLINSLDAIAITTHAIVDDHKTRRLRKIVEIIKVDKDGNASTNTPGSWNPADDKFYFKKDTRMFNKISLKYGLPIETLQKEFEIRTKLLYTFFQNKVLGYEEVQRAINDYQKNPQAVLKKYGVT